MRNSAHHRHFGSLLISLRTVAHRLPGRDSRPLKVIVFHGAPQMSMDQDTPDGQPLGATRFFELLSPCLARLRLFALQLKDHVTLGRHLLLKDGFSPVGVAFGQCDWCSGGLRRHSKRRPSVRIGANGGAIAERRLDRHFILSWKRTVARPKGRKTKLAVSIRMPQGISSALPAWANERNISADKRLPIHPDYAVHGNGFVAAAIASGDDDHQNQQC